MRDHGGRCPGSVTTGCGRRGTPRARSPGAPVGAWRRRLSKPVPGSAKGTIFTACPVSPDESPLNTGRCRPQMHLRDTRIEDTLVILRLLPGWSWSLPRLPPPSEDPHGRAPPGPQPWAPRLLCPTTPASHRPSGAWTPHGDKAQGCDPAPGKRRKIPPTPVPRPDRTLRGAGSARPAVCSRAEVTGRRLRSVAEKGRCVCTAHGESARAARSAGPRAEPCSDELSGPRLSQQESPHGREQFLGFVGTVTFSPRKGSARGAGAVARADPRRRRRGPAFLSFSTRKRHRFRH